MSQLFWPEIGLQVPHLGGGRAGPAATMEAAARVKAMME